ncbi:phosphatase PAP2 family protein [Haloferacaceae archaeon DSL9]
MTLVRVLLEIAVVVVSLCALGSVTLIGRERLRQLRADLTSRLREVAPHIGVLAAVLIANSFLRDILPDVSWVIGINITDTIYNLEGGFVVWIQSFATPGLTRYFAYIYIFGYVFMLVFPLLAYAALSDRTVLRQLVASYSLNYGLGLILYVIFIAYGPRNLLSDNVDSLLYSTYPQFQFLTSEVNVNTNVFPSLHTSLSVTVAAFGYLTRDEYPVWYILSVLLAVSVIISTMYLGIHWATDVVAGVGLAAACVYLSRRYID